MEAFESSSKRVLSTCSHSDRMGWPHDVYRWLFCNFLRISRHFGWLLPQLLFLKKFKYFIRNLVCRSQAGLNLR